ncbi:hypothetical protein GOBAR_AA27930 [Gossypium barbadense]|uniref:Myb-like domain-containing protein n=1 Tax=Gossypium barbadense TaxID=3634 RepID=A0A2P5WNS2_GOSBA|nr:hypothetical protein GOBAR_AA27930 [Gossypium barbadense]
MNRPAVSFQSTTTSAISSSSEMIPMGGYFAPPPMFLPRNSSIITSSPALLQPGNSSGSSFLVDSVAGLNHDTGLAVEWSVDEQYILEDGLEKYNEEPNILKYIKIAASLPEKTVRDVALRCRWMQRLPSTEMVAKSYRTPFWLITVLSGLRKRRKPDEHNAGKKVNNRKDKLVESSSKMTMPSSLPPTMAAYPLMMRHLDQNGRTPSEGICGTTMHLLKQNAQTFSQITSNLSQYKLQDNIDLFCHARNNITAMLNDMREMPGLMSHMPPLPVSVNEDLANGLLPGATNVLPTMIFGSPSGIHLKQEPRC